MPKRLIWWLSIVIAGAGIFYYRQSISLCVRWTSSCVAYPFLKTYQGLSSYVGSYKAWLISKKSFRAQLTHVESQRLAFLAELVEHDATISYYEDIKELHAFRSRYKKYQDSRIVQVLMTHIYPDEHYMLLDAGARDGIQANMLALYNTHLVGKIVEVFPSYSKLRLITDKRIQVAGYCSRTKAKGICSGANGDILELKFVDHLQRIRKDDRVISSGKGLVYPRGLVLGAIASFEKHDVDYTIAVKPLIDLSSLDYCLLI